KGDPVIVDGREFVWEELHLPNEFLSFDDFLGESRDWSAGYAVCYLVAAEAFADLRMKVTSDDFCKIYLNSEPVYEFRFLNTGLLKESGPVQLRQGTNVLVFKVLNGRGPWSGSIRFVTKDGKPVPGIKVTLTPPKPQKW